MNSNEDDGETCFAYDIITEGQVEVRDDVVADEIEFLRNSYDNIRIVEREHFYPKILLALDTESFPKRRVVLEVCVVCGYPFVAPRVRILLPHGITPDESGGLTAAELARMHINIKEAIKPFLLAGAPCIMQIITVVEMVLSAGGERSCTPVSTNNEEVAAGEKISSAQTQGQLQVQAPSAVEARKTSLEALDTVKLIVLLLHLLDKCCHLKDPESEEEARNNFQSLIHYLISEVKVIPKKFQKCVPWRHLYTQRAFREDFRKSMDGKDTLTKWLWAEEEVVGTFKRSSPGRYKSEFIEQRLLGSGGFAPVYVCRKKVDGRLYAVKKIVIKTNQSEKALREVQSLAALSHKNIVRYYDAWIEPGCDEDLIEYLDGDNEEDEEDKESEEEEEEEESSENEDRLQLSRSRNHRTPCYNNLNTSSDEYYSDESDNDATPGVLSTPYLAHSVEYHTLYIQMELCSQKTLRSLIDLSDSEKTVFFTSNDGEKIALRIFRQLLTVVAHFHRENIVHRDLKPDNVLFEMESSINGGESETIRVADFGLARTLQPSVKRNPSSFEVDDPSNFGIVKDEFRPTGNLGSVLYCAPEQERGESYDFKVDEYSLGMIALEMWLAVAGKGFRERFDIMTEVSSGKPLPQWFIRWNPVMAKVISGLLEREPSARSSCEEVLNAGDLPGDPVDIVEALKTIEKHGENIAGRVLHTVQRIIVNCNRKAPIVKKELQKTLSSAGMFDLMQAVNIVGLLHGAVPVACYDYFVPMNLSLNESDVTSVIDMGSKVWALAPHPHISISYFLNIFANPHIGSFYQFYYRIRPYAVFTTPLVSSGLFDEILLDPLLSFLHLLSMIDLTSKLEIIISHADWLKATHPTEAGSQEPPSTVMNMREIIGPSDLIPPVVSRIDSALVDNGLITGSLDRHELVRNFTSRLLEVLPLFGKQIASNITVIIDPALKPCETSVDRLFIDYGLIFECRTQDECRAVAFCCSLDNFASKFCVRSAEIPAYSLSIDLMELSTVGKHIRLPQNEPLLLDGAAVRRQDVYSPSQISLVIASAVKLWSGNIRACLRAEHDNRGFIRAMKAKELQTVVLDGNRIVPLASFHGGSSGFRLDNVPLEKLCTTLRKRRSMERANDLHSDDIVLHLEAREKRALSDDAREVFSIIKESLSHILVVDREISKVDECIRQVMCESTSGESERPKSPELVEWLKNNMSSYRVLPIYSSIDRAVTFFADQKLFKFKNRNESGKRKK
ncbi:Protein kinase domain [Trypanosoma melophagium]|uniref:Protein kinase domain n=1 Tax=Trypanosoma melophagium TaxID=715481 RepID=UPI00351A70C1|nr:Protein kinase domain [Trypanosoma melophagium]